MIDLAREQEATLRRPHYPYSVAARLFFFGMDLVTGRDITLPKAKLIEILASIPYRAWECRQYGRMTRGYRDEHLRERARGIMSWGREAQDNEYWHLLAIDGKMREEGMRDPWYLAPPVTSLMVAGYAVMSRIMAILNSRRAFLFNAEFEDHAEHVYARFVADHPEWDTQPVDSDIVRSRGDFTSWGEVFRRIGLDERDHMNHSFALSGRPERIVRYEGMPPLPGD